MIDGLKRRAEKASRWAQWRFRPGQKSSNSYSGVFSTFAQARAAIGDHVGFDSKVGAALYREKLDRLAPEDYPLLFWLQPIAPSVKRVFDFGGHVGLHYYAFRERLAFAPGLTWTVSDVDAVMDEGRALAQSREASALRFEGGFGGAEGADVMISSGALQYLEAPALLDALRNLKVMPRMLLLNKLPVAEGKGFVTVQDAWTFKAPYTVFSRPQLLADLQSLGYRLKDSWHNQGHHCLVFRRPEISVEVFSGFCFER